MKGAFRQYAVLLIAVRIRVFITMASGSESHLYQDPTEVINGSLIAGAFKQLLFVLLIAFLIRIFSGGLWIRITLGLRSNRSYYSEF